MNGVVFMDRSLLMRALWQGTSAASRKYKYVNWKGRSKRELGIVVVTLGGTDMFLV